MSAGPAMHLHLSVSLQQTSGSLNLARRPRTFPHGGPAASRVRVKDEVVPPYVSLT